MNYEHIETMIGVRNLLLEENDTSDPEYKEILHYVERYIKTHCKHEIIQESEFIKNNKMNIVDLEVNRYNHQRFSNGDLEWFRKSLNGMKSVQILETRQFVNAFVELSAYLKSLNT